MKDANIRIIDTQNQKFGVLGLMTVFYYIFFFSSFLKMLSRLFFCIVNFQTRACEKKSMKIYEINIVCVICMCIRMYHSKNIV